MTKSFLICAIWLMAAGCAIATPIDPALVGYWSFDEGTGTIAHDASGFGNDGTLMNGPIWTAGMSGGALKFNGVDDYVSVPDAASLRPAQFTLAAWINIPVEQDTGWGSYIIAKECSAQGYGLWIDGAQPAALISDGTTGPYNVYSQVEISLNEWHFITSTYNGTELKLYVDGELRNSATHGFENTTEPLTIGAWNCWGGSIYRFFNGIIDQVGIYTWALSPEEIKAEFKSAFTCGDANADAAIDISDVVYLISYIFSGGSAPSPLLAGDTNCDDTVDISDVVYLIAYIFSGGAAPCAAC
jgi:hypothetical protein